MANTVTTHQTMNVFTSGDEMTTPISALRGTKLKFTVAMQHNICAIDNYYNSITLRNVYSGCVTALTQSSCYSQGYLSTLKKNNR